jgi:hypothetical protein
MIELNVKINSVDYANVLDKVLPQILPKLTKNHGELVQKFCSV